MTIVDSPAVNPTLGHALRALRLARGYTRVAVATRTGVSTWEQTAIETGAAAPTPRQFTRLLTFYAARTPR